MKFRNKIYPAFLSPFSINNNENKKQSTKIETHNVRVCSLGKLPLIYRGFSVTAAYNIGIKHGFHALTFTRSHGSIENRDRRPWFSTPPKGPGKC